MTIEAIRSVMSRQTLDVGGRADAAPAASTAVAPVAADAAQTAVDAADKVQQAIAAAAEVRRQLQQKDTQLTIDFDPSLGRAIFKLIDKETGEVLRQIPSPEMLAIAHALDAEARRGVWMRTDA